jgi:signal transduction histidine kinase
LYDSNMRATKSTILADRIVLSMRWLALIGLSLFLGWQNSVNQQILTIIISAAIWNLTLMVLTMTFNRLPYHTYINVGVDAVVGILILYFSLSEALPFPWSGLLPIITGAFYFGLQGGLYISLGVVVVEAILLSTTLGNQGGFQALGIPAAVLFGSGVVFGFISQQIGFFLRQQQALEYSKMVEAERIERERIKALYNITSTMTASLNYRRVLDMALDVTAKALNDPKEGNLLVGGSFLFAGDELYVGSARRFTPSDLKATLPAKAGLIVECLNASQSRILKEPNSDPEIKRIVALRECGEIFCYPLRSGHDMFGAFVFGHPEKDYFNETRLEILEIIGRQAMVAMQNALLYHELEIEKERIQEIQEEARKKLARDLHDGPTQSVAAIAMRVNFARRLIERDVSASAEEMFKIEDLARRTTKEIRHMLFTLRPLVLETSGLIPALESIAQKMAETYDQQVTIEGSDETVANMEVGKQGLVFYIVEEAVNNARKHAEAEHIWVRLIKHKGDVVIVEIQDNGVGFNIGAVDSDYENRGSLGMVNMRERAEMLNGLLQIDSEEGKGTRIRVWVPLNEEAADRIRHGKL